MARKERSASYERSPDVEALLSEKRHTRIWPQVVSCGRKPQYPSRFAEMPRDQRSVQERFNKRFKDFKAKLAKEEKASGINVPPPTEVETLMEEIKELMELILRA